MFTKFNLVPNDCAKINLTCLPSVVHEQYRKIE